MYPHPTLYINENECLRQATSSYLTALEETVPATTFWSHKQAVMSFVDWADSKRTHLELEILVARFVGELAVDSDYTEETVHGYLCSLVNLIAYTQCDDPEVVSIRVINALNEQAATDLSSVSLSLQERLSQKTAQPCGLDKSVSDLFTYLRRSCYGTRTHAYTELILATKSRPNLVQRLDVEDIDLDQGTVQIPISETYLVGSSSLVEAREVDLSSRICRTLEEYVRWNRTAFEQVDTKPLFTTQHGRASRSTLRRGIKRESRQANSTKPDTITSSIVCPSDIWWYAISNTLE